MPANFKVGDEVLCDGSSAIIGDVTAIDAEEGVTIVWRSTTTTEQPEDLHLNGARQDPSIVCCDDCSKRATRVARA